MFALFIYWSAASDRRSEFFVHLGKEAMTRANVLLDAGIEPETLQTIYRQNREILSEVEVAIYDPYFNLLYHDAEDLDFVQETPEMIDEIMEKGMIRFLQEGWEVIGLRMMYNDTPFVITAAAYDEYGHNKLRNLRNVLGVYWFGGVVMMFFAGAFFSSRALQPVSDMRMQVEDITAKNLDLRIDEGNGKDELAGLAITFNRMLDRIEQSFSAQKEFVSNISHELRTPLTAIIGEIELSLNADSMDHKSKKAFISLLSDARKLSKLTNDLLNLAKASYDPQRIAFKEVRLDEIILDARQELLRINPHYNVELFIEEGNSDHDFLTLKGNQYLLGVAFLNLMHNGCKFSDDHTSRVRIRFYNNNVVADFSDNGIGIAEDELPHVFVPFFRGKNHKSTEGSGIGLSLVQRIMNIHKGHIDVESKPGYGTKFTVLIPAKENN